MVESNKKALWIGLAAAGALIGAALIYHYISSEDDEETAGSNTEADPGKL